MTAAHAARWSRSDRRRVLAYVESEPGSTSTDVAADLGLPLATASSHLAAMWRDGRLLRDANCRGFAYRRSTP